MNYIIRMNQKSGDLLHHEGGGENACYGQDREKEDVARLKAHP